MSPLGPPTWAAGRDAREVLARALILLVVVVMGVALGLQYVQPNPRVIGVIAAMAVFGIAWRLDTVSAIGLLVLLLPYPRITVFGNTNLALILLLMVIWLLRTSQRMGPGLQRSPLDAPIFYFLIVWTVSFYNIRGQAFLNGAIFNTQLLSTGVLLFWLVVGNIRTERDLARLHLFQAASAATIGAFVLFEITHPGGKLIPGWIEFRGAGTAKVAPEGMRVGGPFFDYEQLAEWAALNVLFLSFLFARAATLFRRVLLGAVLVLTAFVMFATVTRGAIVSLGVALLYLVVIMRRRIRVVPFTVTVAAVLAGFFGMDFFVSHYTNSGSVFHRLVGTHFVGFVPEARVGAWRDGWDQWMMSPLLGQGPCYRWQIGARIFHWPHNGYLMIASMVGALGLAGFLWMLGTLWVITRPTVDTFTHPSYARAYLIVAHTQLLLWAVDQIKIDWLRNPTSQIQIWLLFASWTVAARLARARPDPAGAPG